MEGVIYKSVSDDAGRRTRPPVSQVPTDLGCLLKCKTFMLFLYCGFVSALFYTNDALVIATAEYIIYVFKYYDIRLWIFE